MSKKTTSKKQNKPKKSIVIFESEPVRREWSEEEEKWYFSVVDVIKILTESSDPRNYWEVFKEQVEKRRKSSGYKVIAH